MKRGIGVVVTALVALAMVAGPVGVAATDPAGCTPGYWKQTHHFDSWPWTGIDPAGERIQPGDKWEDWFDGGLFDGDTLLEVLKQGGGGKYAFGRHAVAGFLNAHSDAVGYQTYPGTPWGTPPGVWDTVKALGDDSSKRAYNRAKRGLERLNEDGCPLN